MASLPRRDIYASCRCNLNIVWTFSQRCVCNWSVGMHARLLSRVRDFIGFRRILRRCRQLRSHFRCWPLQFHEGHAGWRCYQNCFACSASPAVHLSFQYCCLWHRYVDIEGKHWLNWHRYFDSEWNNWLNWHRYVDSEGNHLLNWDRYFNSEEPLNGVS